MTLAAISLFAGAGGMDVGVDSAGFKTLCAIESDPHCAATLRRNGRGKVVWQADVRVVDPVRLLDVLGLAQGAVALLHGGPPLQPSNAPGKQSDPAFEMVRFAEAMRPTAVLIEQSPNFLRLKGSEGRPLPEALRSEFLRLGYDTHIDVLDASDYGVAQRRRCAVLVCVPAGQPYGLPLPAPMAMPTVGRALAGLPAPCLRGETPALANHVDATPPRARQRIAYVPEGLWLSKAPEVPAHILQKLTPRDSTKFRRASRSDVAPTLRCGEALYHPIEDRYITPREAARLQGFSDRYVFEGPIRRRTGTVRTLDQHRQAANATPPPLVRAVASHLRRSLRLGWKKPEEATPARTAP